MDFILSVLVVLILIVFVYWAGHALMNAGGVPAMVQTIFDVVLAFVALLLLLRAFGVALPSLRL